MNHAFDIECTRPEPVSHHFLDGFTIDRALKKTAHGRRFSLVFKRALWMAYEKKCAYCGDDIPSHKAMHVDHFVPLSRGGEDCISNYICACRSCNTAKSGREDIEFLRASIRLRRSGFRSIISPSQLIALELNGAFLPVPEVSFPFEVLL